MSRYFIREFAVNGDKIEIPDDIQPSGEVSYQTGFGLDYQRKLGTDPLAKPFPRQGFNGLMADITGAIKQYQEQGFYNFITPEMNDGQPFSYAMGACVRYDMSDDGSDIRNFSSLINNNTGNPKDNPDDWSDLADTDIEFATNQEAQAGLIDDKVISPSALASVTATQDRRGLIQIATDEEVASGVNATKAITPASLNIHDQSKFIIIYPQGTEEAPPTISTNNRLIIDNPFDTDSIYCEVEIFINNMWGAPGWVSTAGTGTYYGTRANYVQTLNKIIVQSAYGGVGFRYSAFTGDPFGLTASGAIDNASFRIKVWRV